MARHDRHDIHDIHDIHYIHDIHDIHYIHDRHDIHDIHYIHYRQYIQYIHDIHYRHYRHIAFPEVSIQDTTHDMTLLHILTYGSCAHGKGKGTEEKKKQSCAHSCCQKSLTPIQAHALPSACRAESCLLCCQPEPSLSRYLPDYHELLHDSLADCKLKGDKLST